MTPRRIGKGTAFALITAALFIDGVQFLIGLLALIPAVGFIIAFAFSVVVSVLAIFLFAIWFSHIGVSVMNKYPLSFLGVLILEQVPIISTVPGWTWFVVKTIAQERIRERLSSDGV
jgi:hypothetical protein